MATKFCSKCKIEKNVSEFDKNRSHKDGFQGECKKCRKKYCKRYYEDNKIKIIKRNEEYRQKNENILTKKLKFCCSCNTEKNISEFYRHKNTKDGFQTQCKKCKDEGRRRHYNANKKVINKKQAQYNREHREQTLAAGRKYRKNNRTKCNERSKKWVQDNKEHVRKVTKQYQKKNREKINQVRRQYSKKDRVRTKNKERCKRYSAENRERLSACAKIYCRRPDVKLRYNEKVRNKYATDSKFKLNAVIRNKIRVSLHGSKNGRHWEDLVGYTLKQLKKHLEKHFLDGMSWENYGKDGWVIDHKVPISVFNFAQPEHRDFKRCWALKNLQPMWEHDNLVKHNKLEHHFQPSLLI